MQRVFISVGSNIDRERNIRSAVKKLHKLFAPLTISPVYQSEAVGFKGEYFYNLVLAFDTSYSMPELKTQLAAIETQHGRNRLTKRFGPRTLDLDLLIYGNEVHHEPNLNIPRTEITQYAFVLKPLADIAPDSIHPTRGKSYAQLWQEFSGDRDNIKLTDFNANPEITAPQNGRRTRE